LKDRKEAISQEQLEKQLKRQALGKNISQQHRGGDVAENKGKKTSRKTHCAANKARNADQKSRKAQLCCGAISGDFCDKKPTAGNSQTGRDREGSLSGGAPNRY